MVKDNSTICNVTTQTSRDTDRRELLLTYRGVIYPWHCDHMGHMNVMWYVGKFDEATWHLFALIGMPPSFFREQNRGMAAVRQDIAYNSELIAGDIVTIRSGVLEVKEKVIRFFHEMLNEETGEIAASTILTGVHIDTQSRKSCPFPEEILRRGRGMIVEYHPGIGMY
jgi:acyl-CoA thioester hydrolase